jgi:hypothetical protein
MRIVDFTPQVWAYIFAGCVAALLIALRATDLRRQRKH